MTREQIGMSSEDFKPRKARKQQYSENAKTARNRAAEASKRGFEAAELRARIAYRTNKSRSLAKLHKSDRWNLLSPTEQERREAGACEAVERRFFDRMDELRQEWGRKVVEGDLESDEEPSEGIGIQLQHEAIGQGDSGDSGDGWEDIGHIAMTDTLSTVVKESEMGWERKLAKWERVAERETQDLS